MEQISTYLKDKDDHSKMIHMAGEFILWVGDNPIIYRINCYRKTLLSRFTLRVTLIHSFSIRLVKNLAVANLRLSQPDIEPTKIVWN